ncbi:alpha/beta hydrolase family protein [Alloyangia pacifica]|uniref:Predicted dienelactone hydrolase n=1 Tax=Alloyangia pacifica TaxID=311180 RepID=A0A1I6VAJ9_9RHOB|nr:hypothetical protein [Alloyangia pacifica]SDH86658.1 Predicted dienelactone hydrolase [Alloyangia pacifica]SFT10687.1 Predicted dienelactone hydrolase [Alloyangia pacifica]
MFARLTGLALAALLAAPGYAEGDKTGVGVSSMIRPEANFGRGLSMTIWYPAQTGGGASELVGRNAVFEGTPAQREASPLPGKLPLVLLSHGGRRSSEQSGAWLAARLAEGGYIVAEVSGQRPRDPASALGEIWRRPAELGQALDLLLNDPDWQMRIDDTRVAVAGFALGGTAAMMLGGGMIDEGAYMLNCWTGHPSTDCAWFGSAGVDPASVDLQALTLPRRDARVRAVLAIAPEYLAEFRPDSLQPHAPDMRIFGLDQPAPGEVRLAARTGIEVVPLEGAELYDLFARCTPNGAKLLQEEGGDPALCASSPEERSAVHDQVATGTLGFLNRALPSPD